MRLGSLKVIGGCATTVTLLALAVGLSVPKNLAEPSQDGNKFAPRTVAPEQAGGVTEAQTAREAIKARVGTANALGASVAGTATDDGRVYNVLSTVNIRSCPSTSCRVLRVARPGADVLNDPSGGTQQGNGYTWIRVTYGFNSTNACESNRAQGWMIINPLAPGKVRVTKGPLNVRSSPCSGRIIKTLPTGTTLDFHPDQNQWSNKWYKVVVPGATPGPLGYVDGWDFADVY
ncbi:SH3 domain-containing protein [Coleofasciculus sp. FACHB-SPT9]|uniref:SH3 domain-containing protein n=1 Tax=Cyanophyceae TaxID=3028117 RepID=UPI001689BC69|nr:SH3 domain-containing protein [Coleofasciculus sp. FACHB-SPT9]MBD1891562.1 SH3 domain-containing protein [Coleofasciculus sp. FACHB-SPT9]